MSNRGIHDSAATAAAAVAGLGGDYRTADEIQQLERQELLRLSVKQLLLPQTPRLWCLGALPRRPWRREAVLGRSIFIPTVSFALSSRRENPDAFTAAAAAAAAAAADGGFLLQHAAKLHALLTARLSPKLAIR